MPGNYRYFFAHSYLLPLTYGADILHGAFNAKNATSLLTDFALIVLYCTTLFVVSLRNVRERWIL
jgi:ABC-2 type transport system permease protein